MFCRLKKHEVEEKMKEYKRDLLAYATKESTIQRRIQRVKDAMGEALNELSSIPMSRKLEWKNLKWPFVLYPENTHMEFIDKQTIDVVEQKDVILKKMFGIHETILKELKGISKFINYAVVVLTDKVVNFEVDTIIDIACILFPGIRNISTVWDEYYKNVSTFEASKDLESDIPKEPINYIKQILSSVDKREEDIFDGAGIQHEIKASNETFQEESSVLNQSLNKNFEKVGNYVTAKKDNDQELMFKDEKHTPLTKAEKVAFKSWRDIDEEESKNAIFSHFDIDNIITGKSQTLDFSVLPTEFHSSSEDYYMQPFSLNLLNESMNQMKKQFSGLELSDYVEIILDLDTAEVVEDALRMVEENLSLADKNKNANLYFPTWPSGGLVLTKQVLKSMEDKDPDIFPYTGFFQEIVYHEEVFEQPEMVHITPDLKEMKLKYDFTFVSPDDFIVLDVNEILSAVWAYHNMKTTTAKYENEMRILEKKVMKAKSKRINIEQALLAFKRERLAEMNNKFSGIVDLDLLQDVIENPHLRMKKYESEKKIDLMREDLQKLKASEVTALKSLDGFGLEDTKMCHELLQIRHEFKLLKSYSLNIQVTPKINDVSNKEDL